MKTKHTSLFMACLTLALAGSAFAQNGPEMREHMRERMTEQHTKHLGELKTKLKLDASQEASWKTFADSMHAPASMTFPDRSAMTKLSTPERIDKMQALHAQRDAEMKKHGEATKTFYASLNAEQKKTFDAETGRHMQREMGKRGHHHPH